MTKNRNKLILKQSDGVRSTRYWLTERVVMDITNVEVPFSVFFCDLEESELITARYHGPFEGFRAYDIESKSKVDSGYKVVRWLTDHGFYGLYGGTKALADLLATEYYNRVTKAATQFVEQLVDEDEEAA